MWPDSKESTSNGSGWQLDFGKPLTEDWDLEFGVIDYKLNLKNGVPGSFHQTEFGVNGLWFFNDRFEVFAPFHYWVRALITKVSVWLPAVQAIVLLHQSLPAQSVPAQSQSLAVKPKLTALLAWVS
ncbi:MAG: hypothetical protein ACRESO_05770 [Gammaproteobacteria bacterium]